MSLEMDYETIFDVVDSWEALRRIPDHEQVAGTILFTHLFRLCPKIKTLFGFAIEDECNSEAMQQSKLFVQHASNMINMLDRALNMLGPDAELLAEILSDLGRKHARLGVQECYFPYMGEALLAMLREVLCDRFTPSIERAWRVVYRALSINMVQSMNTEKAVLESWAKLQQKVENYHEVVGCILFDRLFHSCPQTKALFGFPVTTKPEELRKSRRFQTHASHFIEMLDKALGMVEAKQMEHKVKELGALHAHFGIKPSCFPIMGEALFFTLERTLGEDWNPQLQVAWSCLYERLSSQIIEAMNDCKS